MSIKEILGKIKPFIEPYMTKERHFFAVLLLTISSLSFILGSQGPGGEVLRLAEREVIDIERISQENTAAPADNDHATSAQKSIETYVASKNSTKYHLPWCSGARRISEENKVWFATKEDAAAAGYTPAANCPGM